MTRVRHSFAMFCVAALTSASTTRASTPSDLLTINVNDPPNGRTHATVQLSPSAGLSIEDALAGQNQLFDLFANAELVDAIDEPFFDPAAYPDAPLLHRWVFAPVTLAPGQPFFGLIGVGSAPPGLTEDQIRNEALANYEIEVDGVLVRGDSLGFLSFECCGGVAVQGYNVTQKINQPGTHRVVYRFQSKRDFCDPLGCFPQAGIWEIEFTVVISGRGHD